MIVARSSSGRSPRTRTTSPATCARSSSGVPVAATRPPSRIAIRWQRSASSGWCVVTMTLVPRAAASAVDLVPDPAQRLGVDAAPGLVQQQQRRLVQQHARDLDAAAHAAGILRRRLVGAIAQLHQRQRLVDAAGGERARQAVQRGAEAQVLARGQLQVQARLLEHDAEARAVRACRWSTTARPSSASVPACGGSRPASRRNAVVLPAPLGPSRPNSSPGATSKLTPSSAARVAEPARQARRRAGAGRARPRAAWTAVSAAAARHRDGPVERQRHEQQRQVDDRVEEQRARPAVAAARRKPAAAQPMNTAPSSVAATA